MTVSNIMQRDIKCCGLSDTIQACAKTMAQNKIGFLPVVGASGELVGTITDRDIVLRAVATGKGPDCKVQDVYSDNPVHVTEDSDISEAEELMAEGHIRRLVVLNGQLKPVGVISLSDIVRNEKDSKRLHESLIRIMEKTSAERTVEEVPVEVRG